MQKVKDFFEIHAFGVCTAIGERLFRERAPHADALQLSGGCRFPRYGTPLRSGCCVVALRAATTVNDGVGASACRSEGQVC